MAHGVDVVQPSRGPHEADRTQVHRRQGPLGLHHAHLHMNTGAAVHGKGNKQVPVYSLTDLMLSSLSPLLEDEGLGGMRF